ncbi:hypothetical protein BC831DRAFT_104152 [Entophlyctis helioformis]|nr:hypothetical protein BC831DRAFT_104152 [Entophlyctis helioformis]
MRGAVSTCLRAYVRHLVDCRAEPTSTVQVHVFARSQPQYLFAGSGRRAGKRVLGDGGLVKWWMRVLGSGLGRRDQDADGAAGGPDAERFWFVPGEGVSESSALCASLVDGRRDDGWRWGLCTAGLDGDGDGEAAMALTAAERAACCRVSQTILSPRPFACWAATETARARMLQAACQPALQPMWQACRRCWALWASASARVHCLACVCMSGAERDLACRAMSGSRRRHSTSLLPRGWQATLAARQRARRRRGGCWMSLSSGLGLHQEATRSGLRPA